MLFRSVVYLVLAILVFAAWRFDRSRLGYAARACRDNRVTAAAMGINVTWVKTLVFALGGAIAGVGGVFRSHFILVQNPDDMGFFFSLTFLIYWVFGGSYVFWGPVFGAMFLTIVPEALRFSVQERFIMYGLILTAIVILRPQGVITRVPLGSQVTLFGLVPLLRQRLGLDPAGGRVPARAADSPSTPGPAGPGMDGEGRPADLVSRRLSGGAGSTKSQFTRRRT